MTGERRSRSKAKVPLTEAQRALVERSTLVFRLALSLARRAAPVTYDELVSAGNEELVRAASRYVANPDVSFDAYAFTSVHFAMLKAIAKARREARNELVTAALAAGHDFLEAERATNPLEEAPAEALAALDNHTGAFAATLALGFAAAVARLSGEQAIVERLAHERLIAELGDVLAGMPEARRLIELRYFEAREWNEVAQELGCSSATARRQHAAAIRLLGARIRGRGIEACELGRE